MHKRTYWPGLITECSLLITLVTVVIFCGNAYVTNNLMDHFDSASREVFSVSFDSVATFKETSHHKSIGHDTPHSALGQIYKATHDGSQNDALETAGSYGQRLAVKNDTQWSSQHSNPSDPSPF